MEAQWRVICNDLRRRVLAGEWAVGDRLPPIKDLQDEYKAHSLNTVRSAQQVLVEEGLLQTHQGRGAFVVSLTPTTNGAGSRDPQPEAAEHAVTLGLRIEFYGTGKELQGSIAREDVRGVGVPRVGDRVGPGSLGDLVHDVAGVMLDIDSVEHYFVAGASTDGPLAIAVVRVHDAATPTPQDLTALQEDGWLLSLAFASSARATTAGAG